MKLTSKAELEDALARAGMVVDGPQSRARVLFELICKNSAEYDECVDYPPSSKLNTTLPLATLCAIYDVNGE